MHLQRPLEAWTTWLSDDDSADDDGKGDEDDDEDDEDDDEDDDDEDDDKGADDGDDDDDDEEDDDDDGGDDDDDRWEDVVMFKQYGSAQRFTRLGAHTHFGLKNAGECSSRRRVFLRLVPSGAADRRLRPTACCGSVLAAMIDSAA
jgi:hypothetical protein